MPDLSVWASAENIMERHGKLGIPHFQRGLVWGADSVALLLESLFYATPCGSLILWQPLHPREQGIPLGQPEHLQQLIIDGQQRIRSLRSVFERASSEPDDFDRSSNGEPEQLPRVWCVDLTHVPSLGPHFGPRSRFPLFRFVADPSHPKARRWKALVPIAWLRDGESDRVEEHVTTHDGSAAVEALRESGLADRLRAMTREPLFAVRVLEETGERNRLADVVAVYNRINSAGKRVEAEERAYAALVSYAPDARHWLRELFAAIHTTAGATEATADRDDVLQRRKESAFGFKLFLRTFVQVAAYHLNLSIGTSGFSFDLLQSEGFHRQLSEPANAHKVAGMLEHTKEILVFIRAVLRQELHCDDLRMLPEASSLWPVVQMLTRFPALVNEHESAGRQLTAGLILRLYLAPREARELLRLVGIVNRANTARACIESLSQALDTPELRKRLAEGLRGSQSLQDRYLLLLYWLLRRSGFARDFSYENLIRLGRPRPDHSELPVCEQSRPEKQHILPYSLLAPVYELSGRDRVSSHPVNDIGNLTYISAWLNSFEHGLGGDAFTLVGEPEENAMAHFLAKVEGVDPANAFENALLAASDVRDAATRHEARVAYETFFTTRRTVIERAFVEWLEATADWALALADTRRIDPEELHFLVTDAERVRLMRHPEPIMDVMLEWIGAGVLRRVNRSKQVGQREVFSVLGGNGKKGPRLKLHLLPAQLVVEPIGPDEVERVSVVLSGICGPTPAGAIPVGWVMDLPKNSDMRAGADALRILVRAP